MAYFQVFITQSFFELHRLFVGIRVKDSSDILFGINNTYVLFNNTLYI